MDFGEIHDFEAENRPSGTQHSIAPSRRNYRTPVQLEAGWLVVDVGFQEAGELVEV